MTDELIIKNFRNGVYKNKPMLFGQKFLNSALDLINRQKAEIEQWKEEADRWQNAFCKVNEDMSTIKSEAIKEFAERLKRTSIGLEIGDDKKFKMTVVSTVAIDNLVKEMTEKCHCGGR